MAPMRARVPNLWQAGVEDRHARCAASDPNGGGAGAVAAGGGEAARRLAAPSRSPPTDSGASPAAEGGLGSPSVRTRNVLPAPANQ